MRSFLSSIALSFLALPLLAVDVDPAAPTSATPVTITVHEYASCPPPPDVTRSGNTFNVVLRPGPCLVPPAYVTFAVPLGKLAPADYEVVVTAPSSNSNPRIDYGAFFVSDADATLSISSPPFGPTTGGTTVEINPAGAINCVGVGCPMPQVFFDGTPATIDAGQLAHGLLVVTTPPNPKGIADVVVVGSGGRTSGRVFRYYDPSEGPLPSMFERVLVPVWFSGAGAFDSNWTTEVTTLNPGSHGFEPYRRSPVPSIAPLATTSLNFGAPRAGGVLFFMPRGFSPPLRFGSLVRDTSRGADDWGTEVRVVRESDLRTTDFSLMNVPLDARFRDTLRIYDADSVEGAILVDLYTMDGTWIGEGSVPLHSANPCNPYEPCPSDDPAAAAVDLNGLVPDVAAQGRVRVEVRNVYRQRLWAFVSVTNNQTQHVTVITPQ